MPIPTTPVDLTGASERAGVYDRLLDAVVTGRLSPGQRLVEEDLCRDFAASRAAVGDALARLSLVGLTTVVPRRSTHVTPMDPRRIAEGFGVLDELTSLAIVVGEPLLTDEDLTTLAAYRDTWLADDDAAREAVRTSRVLDVHRVFFRRARNADLDRVRSWLSPALARFLHQCVDTVDVHAVRTCELALVAAALDGDVPATVAACHAGTAALPAPGSDVPPPTSRPPAAPLIRERAIDTIRRAILDGTLLPGEVLRESDLMRWLGVSRTPVRDALAMLAHIGIVEQRFHQPARVATLDSGEVADAMRTAGVLRLRAQRLCVAKNPQPLLDALDAGVAALEADDSTATRIDVAARTVDAVLAGAQDGVLTEVLERLAPRVRWYATHEPSVVDAFDATALRELRDAVASDDLDRAATVTSRFYDLPGELVAS